MSDYKCPHCEYYMWEGKEFYECDMQDRVSKLEQENTELKSTIDAFEVSENEAIEIIAEYKAENARLKSCLQEIKEIAEKFSYTSNLASIFNLNSSISNTSVF